MRVDRLLDLLNEYYPAQLFVSRGKLTQGSDYEWQLWTRRISDDRTVLIEHAPSVSSLYKQAKLRAIRIALKIATEENRWT